MIPPTVSAADVKIEIGSSRTITEVKHLEVNWFSVG